MREHTTRRAVFAGAAGLAALAIPLAALAASPTDLRNIERKRNALIDQMNSFSFEGDDSEGMALYQRSEAFDMIIREAPVLSPSDAAVKLRSVFMMFERGERSDGTDEVVMAQVINWLGTV